MSLFPAELMVLHLTVLQFSFMLYVTSAPLQNQQEQSLARRSFLRSGWRIPCEAPGCQAGEGPAGCAVPLAAGLWVKRSSWS